MKLGFTGTRNGMTPEQRSAFKSLLAGLPSVLEFHHGDCRGADMDACCLYLAYAQQFDDETFERATVVVHPPDYDGHRAFCMEKVEYYQLRLVVEKPKPFLDRNRDIVDASELMVACPAESTEQLRGGTWSTVRYARKVGRELVVILPDGTTQ